MVSHDMELPAAWNRMSSEERSQWLAKWLDLNVDMHQRIRDMEREKAQKEWKNYRKKNGRGKRRK